MGLIRFRYDDQAGRIFIQTVNDTKTILDLGFWILDFKVIGHSIRQRAVLHASAGMNDHACGLINYREVLVFKDDVERNIFGLKSCRRDLSQLDVDLIAFADPVG
jgi:hypothetical protein